MRQQVPLIWLYGLQPALFQAIYPVYLSAEEPSLDQFVLALTEDQRTVRPGSPVEETFRRYLIARNEATATPTSPLQPGPCSLRDSLRRLRTRPT